MSTRSRVLIGLGIVFTAALSASVTYANWGHHPEMVAADALRRTTSPRVVLQTPRAGTRVPWGSVVTLRVVRGFIGMPSGPKELPSYRVPAFVGKRLAEAIGWTRGKHLYWETRLPPLPPLPPSSARHLFDAYVVAAQRPAAGSRLRRWIPIPHGVHLTPLVLDVALR
ncbi:MAG: hypothetical protein M3R39_01860 [Actinomycetota bacterium]|nr:hypothetical protein [Actinomycetota bacterium]